ncbi:hypothetical protein [Tsuneonella suprasediminis]|uniref:hypothetical protein n=1 Tax=Tsuneonella suprasediminis TaxID=2306996 RepID=UPI002F9264AD
MDGPDPGASYFSDEEPAEAGPWLWGGGDGGAFMLDYSSAHIPARHCERSEAIHGLTPPSTASV